VATFTTPVDTATDELITPARFNAQVMANLRNLITKPACRVGRSADKSLTDATLTNIDWDQETYDTDTMHDNTTNNSRITFTTAGLYLVTFNTQIAAAADYSIVQARILLSGTTSIATGSTQGTAVSVGPSLSVSGQYKFSAAQWVVAELYHDNTANAARNMLTASSSFSAAWLSS
jgi:hypothetical protein